MEEWLDYTKRTAPFFMVEEKELDLLFVKLQKVLERILRKVTATSQSQYLANWNMIKRTGPRLVHFLHIIAI